MARRKLGVTYFGGIGDFLRIAVLIHSPLLQWINRGRTPVRWNDGGSASSKLVNDFMVSRMPGFYEAETGEEFDSILEVPRWHRFLRWTRRPIQFRLTEAEEAGLPKLSASKLNIAICPHHNGLACKKLPNESINKIIALLRAKLDAEFYIFDERVDASAVDAPCIGGLNLTQAMVLMGRFDAAISVDSWQKYIMGMLRKPQTVLVVDFRKNESYTIEDTPGAVYQEFFRWRMKPSEILGYKNDFSEFEWMAAAEVAPEVIAEHLLRQLTATGRGTG
ncbi:MAG: hypothetical protein ABSE62_00100 [Chthoniobacteraceae bacterium]|jgi:ADP-heptose:LPS heptosyltransferase